MKIADKFGLLKITMSMPIFTHYQYTCLVYILIQNKATFLQRAYSMD